MDRKIREELLDLINNPPQLVSVAEMVTKLANNTLGVINKIRTVKYMSTDSGRFVLSDDIEILSAAALHEDVKYRACEELDPHEYIPTKGTSQSPARYPEEWLRKIIMEELGL